MIDETYGSKRFNRFSLLSLMMAIVFVISIALPQQVTLANDHVDWQLKMIGADQAHEDGHKGEGITIAVIDDGAAHGDVVADVVKHVAPNATVRSFSASGTATTEGTLSEENFEVELPVLSLNIGQTLDLKINDDEIKLTFSENGKLTHNSLKLKDVEINQNNKVIGKYTGDSREENKVKLSMEGMTTEFLVREIENASKEEANVDIINMSIGTSDEDTQVSTAIESAVGKGILVVASSGNDDKDFPYFPASHNDVIAVAAVDKNGDKLNQQLGEGSIISNGGQVSAPGIFSTVQFTHYGTSIASPYVAGLAALYMNQINAKNGLSVKNLIKDNLYNGIVQYVPVEKEEIDKTALQDAIDEAGKIKKEDYTQGSFEDLTKALNDAKSVNQDKDATQEVVDNAITALETAIDKLEKSNGNEVNGDGDSGDGGNGGSTGEGDGKEPGDGKGKDLAPTKPGKPSNPGPSVTVEDDETITPKAAPAPVVVEVGKTTPTPVQAEQAVRIGNTGSSIVMPVDLPTGVTITVKKVENTDDIVKDARTANLQIAGDIYTIELDNLDYNELDGTFTLTLNYDKDAEGTPAIYYYNEDTKEWERRGGRVNAEEGTISIEVEHFSTYGVFVNPKALPATATDIYTYIMFGLILIGLGFIVKLSGRRKAFVK